MEKNKITIMAKEILKKSVDISKGRFINHLNDVILTIHQMAKSKNRNDIDALFNQAENHLSIARKNFDKLK